MSEWVNWQDEWGRQAGAEQGALESAPVETLIKRVQVGQFGAFYTLWDAIAQRAPLADYLRIFLDVLQSEADYLDRYHCASALLAALGTAPFAPVDLAGDHEGRAERLARFGVWLHEAGYLSLVEPSERGA